MSDLLARYIHQVGNYVPPQERAEIEAELRSQIQDQLDDRFGGQATPQEIASVLQELGAPYRMAAAYQREQVLVGAELYPTMMIILRRVWLLAPLIVAFVQVFSALTTPQPIAPLRLAADVLVSIVQAVFFFSGVVVFTFAMLQRQLAKRAATPFDPFALPPINDPRAVDRIEAAFGIVLGIGFILLLMYFLRVGGLTLQLNPQSPIAFHVGWMLTLISMVLAMMLTQAWVLRSNRWTLPLWVAETLMELIGLISLYYAILQPLVTHYNFGGTSLLSHLPEAAVILHAVLMLAVRGNRAVRLWNNRRAPAPF